MRLKLINIPKYPEKRSSFFGRVALFLSQALICKYKIMELGFLMENMSNSYFFSKKETFSIFLPLSETS